MPLQPELAGHDDSPEHHGVPDRTHRFGAVLTLQRDGAPPGQDEVRNIKVSCPGLAFHQCFHQVDGNEVAGVLRIHTNHFGSPAARIEGSCTA